MLKAIFLDLDETLCDTTGANNQALQIMAAKAKSLLGDSINDQAFAAMYLKGIYRDLDQRYSELLLPVKDEGGFRIALVKLILSDLGIAEVTDALARTLQSTFDNARTACFDFFPTIKQLLLDLRSRFILVVITNGPEFSQVTKVEAVNLSQYVDHIIIGGQEPEQKPAVSIFRKALRLAGCDASEAIHIGDSLMADIAGASNSKIASVWVSHGQDLDESLDIEPTHIIETPLQLPQLIEFLAR
jgi:N-acylneuraminate-9-phosphatase